MGVRGENQVYLDLTHKPRDYLETKLGAILEIYRKFVGEDPCELPMRIFPGVHYSMGGLWTEYTATSDGQLMEYGAPNSMMTGIPGLFAFGEVNYQYHGATRLGANALLSCIFDGLFCGHGVANHAREHAGADADETLFTSAVEAETALQSRLTESSGNENPYAIAKSMGDEMTAAATVVKTEARMTEALDTIRSLQDRAKNIGLSDTGLWTNQNLSFARAVPDMLALAEVMLMGGIERKESRGSHYRTDYPDRVDDPFLASTVAKWNGGSPSIEFEPVQLGIVEPRARTYGKKQTA